MLSYTWSDWNLRRALTNAPYIIRSTFYLDGAPHSAVRFSAPNTTYLAVLNHVALNARLGQGNKETSYTTLFVGRYWGTGQGALFTPMSGNICVGLCHGLMNFFFDLPIGDDISPATVKNSAYNWQIYGFTMRGENATQPSEAVFFRGATELGRRTGYYGYANPALGYYADVDAAEVLIFDRMLSSDEFASVVAYLQARYGVDGENRPVTASASVAASSTPTASLSVGASATPTITPTAAANRCAVDEAFTSAVLPASWSARPDALVSFPSSTSPRGSYGAVVTDPLGTASAFAYLLTGAGAGNSTELSFVVEARHNGIQLSADLLFDAGDELPFNGQAAVTVQRLANRDDSSLVCGSAAREGESFTITCPFGSKIISIPFASYGNPSFEACAAGAFGYGACHTGDSQSVVEAACLGRTTCTLQQQAASYASTSCGQLFIASLVVVVECSDKASDGVVWSRDTASVGAYSQSGWQHLDYTVAEPGTYKVTLRLRAWVVTTQRGHLHWQLITC